MKKVVLLIFLSFVAVYADLKSITTAEFVRECPAAKRELPRADLERLATVLQGKHWKSGISNLINAFKQVKKSERQEVIDSLFHLRKEHIKSSTLAKLINGIVTVEPGHRKEVAQSARDLVKYCEGISEVQNLINILAKIPAGQRVRVAEKVLERSSKEESYDSVASKLAHESSIPLAEAEETPSKTEEGGTYPGCWKALPMDEKAVVMDWVRFFLNESSPKKIEKFVEKFIRGVLLIPEQRRSSLLESIKNRHMKNFYISYNYSYKTNLLDPRKIEDFFIRIINLTPSHSKREVIEAVFSERFFDELFRFQVNSTFDELVKAPAEEQGEVAMLAWSIGEEKWNIGGVNLAKNFEFILALQPETRLSIKDYIRGQPSIVDITETIKRQENPHEQMRTIKLFHAVSDHFTVKEVFDNISKELPQLNDHQMGSWMNTIKTILEKKFKFNPIKRAALEKLIQPLLEVPEEQNRVEFANKLYEFTDFSNSNYFWARRDLSDSNSFWTRRNLSDSNSFWASSALSGSIDILQRFRAQERFEVLQTLIILIQKNGHGLEDFNTILSNMVERVQAIPTGRRLPVAQAAQEIGQRLGGEALTQGIFTSLSRITDEGLQSQMIDMFREHPTSFMSYYCNIDRLRNAELLIPYASAVMNGYVAAEAERQEGARLDWDLIASNALQVVMPPRQEPQFHQGRVAPRRGQAYEIHDATESLVTYGARKIPVYKAIQEILINTEGVVKMPLRRCLQEMRRLSKPQAREDINSALAKAYYNPDAQESLAYSDIITILLGYVWPYMKTLSRDTQRAWLKLAVDEARMAYDGTYGLSLSCSKGIQERLVVTGFESFLADVDPRLIALSTFAKMSATDFEGLFQPALRSLPKASYEKILRIHQSDATKMWFQNLFQEAFLSLAHDVPEFGVDTLQLAEDFACAEKFQSEVRNYAELYANPEYQKLDELKSLATRKISEINEREQEDPTMTASHLLPATGEGAATHKRSLFLRYREHKITKPLIVERSYQQAIESREAGDFKNAFETFLFHAVYLDNPKAMHNIGFILYEKGDLISAHEWMSAAAGHGLDSAKKSLKKLAVELECTEANEEMAARLFLQKDQSTLIFIRGGWSPIAEGNIFESYESMNDHEILQKIAFSKNPGVALRYTALHEEDQVALY